MGFWDINFLKKVHEEANPQQQQAATPQTPSVMQPLTRERLAGLLGVGAPVRRGFGGGLNGVASAPANNTQETISALVGNQNNMFRPGLAASQATGDSYNGWNALADIFGAVAKQNMTK